GGRRTAPPGRGVARPGGRAAGGGAVSEPHEQTPSAGLFAELQGLLGEADARKRGARAWEGVVRASANRDFAVVLDFALEHGLVRSPGAGREALPDGQRVHNSTWVNPADGSEMVWVPPGPFIVGEDNERAHSEGFSLARHPVTNAQFQRFLDA